jgi:hypothetical protein
MHDPERFQIGQIANGYPEVAADSVHPRECMIEVELPESIPGE